MRQYCVAVLGKGPAIPCGLRLVLTHLGGSEIRKIRWAEVLILALWFGWSQAPKELTVHMPPDLRSGAVLAVDEVPPSNVYAFAFYIFQQLNRWPKDGARDYGQAIFSVSPYLTPKYRADLIADMELKGQQGELAYRVRGVQEIPGHGYEERRVDILKDGVWVV